MTCSTDNLKKLNCHHISVQDEDHFKSAGGLDGQLPSVRVPHPCVAARRKNRNQLKTGLFQSPDENSFFGGQKMLGSGYFFWRRQRDSGNEARRHPVRPVFILLLPRFPRQLLGQNVGHPYSRRKFDLDVFRLFRRLRFRQAEDAPVKVIILSRSAAFHFSFKAFDRHRPSIEMITISIK